jgi:hypothetical protein
MDSTVYLCIIYIQGESRVCYSWHYMLYYIEHQTVGYRSHTYYVVSRNVAL